MRQSHLFGKTTKQIPKDEKSINAQLLIKAGFIDKLMAGVYSYLPLGFKVFKNIENIIREEMNAVGGQEILMPALQPKELWEETGRWDKMDIMYKFKDRSGRELSLGPTHEEIITDIVRKQVKSYKDLPFALYQIQDKFRDEPRAKSGLLRGREFVMKDLYSFHRDERDLNEYYEIVKNTYLKIFKRTGLEAISVEASGGVFTKEYSHEFMVKTPAGEDITIYCEFCGFAQNKEIALVKEGDKCPECGKEILKASKTVEGGNIFKLGVKFSQDMGALFMDSDGTKKPIIMGCYGIGLGRLMGTVVEVSHDDKGIIWPKTIAPYQFHLILLGEGKALVKKAEELYNILTKENLEVLYDDRDLSAGVKLSDSDLIGIPFRLILSEKTLAKKSVELKERKSKEIKLIPLNKIVKEVKLLSR